MEVVVALIALTAGILLGWFIAQRTVPARRQPVAAVAPPETPRPVPALQLYGPDLLDGHSQPVAIVGDDGRVWYRNVALSEHQDTHFGVLLDQAIEELATDAIKDETTERKVVELHGPPKTILALSARRVVGAGVVVFVRDITEARYQEQVRTDFVANISHELKTPIGALAVLAETVEGETDPAIIVRLTERMAIEAQRATRTVDDLMELSEIEGGLERPHERISIHDVVRGALDRVAELAPQHDIEVSMLGSDEDSLTGLVAMGCRRQLISAVGNLVENAVKYSEPGGAVQVRAHRAGDMAEIMVADNGVGIPKRDLDRVFERFYRVDRARSRSTGGSGLGLSIVRHIAAKHNGEVSVSSSEGEGSTFVLRVPLIPTEPTEPPGAAPAGTPAPNTLKQERL